MPCAELASQHGINKLASELVWVTNNVVDMLQVIRDTPQGQETSDGVDRRYVRMYDGKVLSSMLSGPPHIFSAVGQLDPGVSTLDGAQRREMGRSCWAPSSPNSPPPRRSSTSSMLARPPVPSADNLRVATSPCPPVRYSRGIVNVPRAPLLRTPRSLSFIHPDTRAREHGSPVALLLNPHPPAGWTRTPPLLLLLPIRG
jgi:hypothetical protein